MFQLSKSLQNWSQTTSECSTWHIHIVQNKSQTKPQITNHKPLLKTDQIPFPPNNVAAADQHTLETHTQMPIYFFILLNYLYFLLYPLKLKILISQNLKTTVIWQLNISSTMNVKYGVKVKRKKKSIALIHYTLLLKSIHIFLLLLP